MLPKLPKLEPALSKPIIKMEKLKKDIEKAKADAELERMVKKTMAKKVTFMDEVSEQNESALQRERDLTMSQLAMTDAQNKQWAKIWKIVQSYV